MTVPPPDLPLRSAWFVHRDASGARRLGAVRADGHGGGQLVDLGVTLDGPLGAEPWLARDALTETALERLLDGPDTAPLTAPPRYEAPLVRPTKIACLGKNFAAHAAEFGAEVPDEPLVFTKLADTLCAHGESVLLPAAPPDDRPRRVDHEAELALVLGFADPDGHGRRRIDPHDAWSCVAGVCPANDVTARSLQGRDRKQGWPWLRAKSFETFLPLGPFVTPTSGRPFDLAGRRVRALVDDAVRQDADLADMVVDVPRALAWLSRIAPLRTGDVVLMGTPEGVGPLHPGAVVTVSIDGLGSIRNPVEAAAHAQLDDPDGSVG